MFSLVVFFFKKKKLITQPVERIFCYSTTKRLPVPFAFAFSCSIHSLTLFILSKCKVMKVPVTWEEVLTSFPCGYNCLLWSLTWSPVSQQCFHSGSISFLYSTCHFNCSLEFLLLEYYITSKLSFYLPRLPTKANW